MLLTLLVLGGLAHAQTGVNLFDCASNASEMQKKFPVEMKYLKSFEGIWSDVSVKVDPMSPDFRAFNVKSSKDKIEIQMELSRDGQARMSPIKEVRVCPSANGPVLHGDGVEIPLYVLNKSQLRMKIGGNWSLFVRQDHNLKHQGFSRATTEEFNLGKGSSETPVRVIPTGRPPESTSTANPSSGAGTGSPAGAAGSASPGTTSEPASPQGTQ